MLKGFMADSIGKKPLSDSLLPKCGACGLLNKCQTPKQPVYGLGRRKILIVGNFPTREDDSAGHAFSDWLGDRIRDEFEDDRFNLYEDAWVTNALICSPQSTFAPAELVKHCRPNLIKTIKTLKPEIIIPMGYLACLSVLGWAWKEGIGTLDRWVGWEIPSIDHNAWICPTYSEIELLGLNNDTSNRDGVVTLRWSEQVRRALDHTGRPYETPPDYHSRCHTMQKESQIVEFLEDLSVYDGPVAFDYETTTLKPDAAGPAQVVSMSVCADPEIAIAFPVTPNIRFAIRNFLRSPTPKVAANKKFEDRWSRKFFGTGVRNWVWDTMLGAHILDGRENTKGLKFQAFVQLGVPSYDDHIHPYLDSPGSNTPNRVREIDLRSLLHYNAMDSLLELLLYRKQQELFRCRH